MTVPELTQILDPKSLAKLVLKNSWYGEEVITLAQAYLDLLATRGEAPVLKCYPSILLASGEYFEFLHPERSSFSEFDIANALSKIARFNGHNLSCMAYTVAQHCVLASHYAPVGFKFEALMHDAPEAFTGDITTPLKQLIPDFQQIENNIEAACSAKFRLPAHMSPEVKRVDLEMAATEKRDLMPHDTTEWMMLKDITPYAERLSPWPSSVARDAWLDRFKELYPDHLRRVDERELFERIPV